VTEGTATWLGADARGGARLVEGDRFARSGEWKKAGILSMADFMGADLTGRTLLIVGAGRIGFATALRSIGWGMRVLYTRGAALGVRALRRGGAAVTLEEGCARERRPACTRR